MLSHPELGRILSLAEDQQLNHGLDPAEPIHGTHHWINVAQIAGAIAHQENSDVLGAQAFGLLHDCCRENDNHDPQHGPRAAQWIRSHKEIKRILGRERAAAVALACEIHTLRITTKDPFCGACLDADRITLHRVGITPNPFLFSTETGKKFISEKSPCLHHEAPGYTLAFHGSKYPFHGPPKPQKGILYAALDEESASFYGPPQKVLCSFSKLADLRDPMGIIKTPIFERLLQYHKDEFAGQPDRNGEPLDLFTLLESGGLYHELNRSGQESFLKTVFSWGYDAVLVQDISHSVHPTLVLNNRSTVENYNT